MTSKKKILAIATSADPSLKGKKTGLWLSELTHFLDVIVKAGWEFDVASPRGGKIPLDEGSATESQLKDPVNARFMKDPRFVAQLESSIALSDIDPSAYDAAYLAGGHGTMFDFRESADLKAVLAAIYGAGRPLSGVCHGVSGLVDVLDANGKYVVEGRRVTGFSNAEDTLAGVKKLMPYLLEDALKERGARYKKNLVPFTERVEVDGALITGQNPQSAKAVGEALVAALG
jgi:putative intracellular protease/amidase